MFKKLTVKEIKKEIGKINSDWLLNDKASELQRKFVLATFLEAFMFLTKISIYAEIAKIYPKIELSGHKVKVTFVTSAKLPFNKTDFDLINKIDSIFNLSTINKTNRHY